MQVNNISLRFEDPSIEEAYQRANRGRQRALWLRALLVSSLFQALFHFSDVLEYGDALQPRLNVVVPARLSLAIMLLVQYGLVHFDLVQPRQDTMLAVSLLYGIPTTVLHLAQKEVLRQWDALFLVYGLSFFIVPKMSPLQFLPASLGSVAVAAVYFWFAVRRRPPGPGGLAEVWLALVYALPVVFLFNTASYSYEKAGRERFVLRTVLKTEHRHHVSLAVVRGQNMNMPHISRTLGRGRLLLALLPWALLALGRRTHKQWEWDDAMQRLFGGTGTAAAGLTHLFGLGLFLLIVTKQVRFLFAVPGIGITLLWVAAQAPLSPHTLEVSMQSVGHVMLASVVVFALGAFGWVVYGWNQLVGFVRRTWFLYPAEAEDSLQHYPILRSIVTASLAQGGTAQSMPWPHARPPPLKDSAPPSSSVAPTSAHTKQPSGTSSKAAQAPSRDPGERGSEGETAASLQARVAGAAKPPGPAVAAPVLSLPVLDMKQSGMCAFCDRNAQAYLVPVCRRWGLWALWRVEVNALFDKGATEEARALPVAQPCTSFHDMTLDRDKLQALNNETAAKLKAANDRIQQLEAGAGSMHHGRQEAQARHRADMAALQHAWEDRVASVVASLNAEAKAHGETAAALTALTQQHKDACAHHAREAARLREVLAREEARANHLEAALAAEQAHRPAPPGPPAGRDAPQPRAHLPVAQAAMHAHVPAARHGGGGVRLRAGDQLAGGVPSPHGQGGGHGEAETHACVQGTDDLQGWQGGPPSAGDGEVAGSPQWGNSSQGGQEDPGWAPSEEEQLAIMGGGLAVEHARRRLPYTRDIELDGMRESVLDR